MNRVINRYHNRRNACSGMTLVEVMIASSMLVILTAALISASVVGTRVNYASAQRVAAFGLCKERLEQMRALDFTNIATASFPFETITLTHAGGTARLAIACTRATTIVDHTMPTRKDIGITVAWNFGGKTLQESLQTTLYQKE